MEKFTSSNGCRTKWPCKPGSECNGEGAIAKPLDAMLVRWLFLEVGFTGLYGSGTWFSISVGRAGVFHRGPEGRVPRLSALPPVLPGVNQDIYPKL